MKGWEQKQGDWFSLSQEAQMLDAEGKTEGSDHQNGGRKETQEIPGGPVGKAGC